MTTAEFGWLGNWTWGMQMLTRGSAGEEEGGLFAMRDLMRGMPTVNAFAMLCSRALAGLCREVGELGPQAEALLCCAAARGLIELRAQTDRIDSSERLLAVTVETGDHERRVFRKKADPEWTMGFVEGFRRLCESGLVMHLAGSEFVLTAPGFERARTLDPANYRELMAGAMDEEV